MECDTLVIEPTYGHPDYVFRSQEQTLATATRMLRACLDRASARWCWAGRLGKAQKLLHHLLAQRFEVMVEAGIYEAVQAYCEGGVDFPGKVTAFDVHWPDDTVALFPPGKYARVLNGYRYQRTMELTSWAASDSRHHRRRPADFNDLLSYVEPVRPRRVYTVYGFTDLAANLCAKGYPAVHIDGKTPSAQGFQSRMV